MSDKRELTREDRDVLARVGIRPTSVFTVAAFRTGMILFFIVSVVFSSTSSLWNEWKHTTVFTEPCDEIVAFATSGNTKVAIRKSIECVHFYLKIPSDQIQLSLLYHVSLDYISRLIIFTIAHSINTTRESNVVGTFESFVLRVFFLPAFLTVIASVVISLVMAGFRFAYVTATKKISTDFTHNGRILEYLIICIIGVVLLRMVVIQAPQVMVQSFYGGIDIVTIQRQLQSVKTQLIVLVSLLVLLSLTVGVFIQLWFYFRYRDRIKTITKRLRDQH